MKNFFKTFFASLLALFVFSILMVFFTVGLISVVSSSTKEETGRNAVLVLDLSQQFLEIGVENPLASLGTGDQYDVPSSYDLVRMISNAARDSAVKGIYIKCGSNLNGFGTSEEIRNALLSFRRSGKFILAYAEVINQGGYYVANVANKVYCNPQGGIDWRGFSVNYFFLKGMLNKLEIEPQIFYAGKFKSATEPFRETKMSEANRQQTTELLSDLYTHFLLNTAKERKLDTASLHALAENNSVRSAHDALRSGLVDGLRYEDEVRSEIRTRLGIPEKDKINFVPMGKYAKSVSFKKTGKEKVAVIYAQGDIISGKGEQQSIGSESYRSIIEKVRTDASVKAIVFRINSGGGSAMASEVIWRELSLAKKDKPVIISFGDVAASGGYYLSCNADSIFAQPNTITGSIGVFSILPNMQKFFDDKLGVTFDGVKTASDADALSVIKPLNEAQKRWLQSSVDSIYQTFLKKVSEGRRRPVSYIDSIGQGRVWSGSRALELGLVDRIGGLQEAIDCAVRLAGVKDYRLREYPEPKNIFDMLFNDLEVTVKAKVMESEMSPEEWKLYRSVKRVREMAREPQARLPFDMVIE